MVRQGVHFDTILSALRTSGAKARFMDGSAAHPDELFLQRMTEAVRYEQTFASGRIVELSDVPATRSVLDWLRENAHCTGTKEGCAVGDTWLSVPARSATPSGGSLLARARGLLSAPMIEKPIAPSVRLPCA